MELPGIISGIPFSCASGTLFQKDQNMTTKPKIAYHLGGDDEHLLVSVDGQILKGEPLNKFCEELNSRLDCRGTGAVAERLGCDLNQSLRVRLHHESQFGAVDWCRLGIKLGEESGELQGKIIRLSENRDGKDWRPEMLSELKDVLTVLHVIASRLEKDLNDLSSEAAEYFVTRDFPNIEKQNSAENLGQ